MEKRTLLTLILIFLLAFLLRFYKIADNPPSLNWDEVSIGYNAYSILKTGKDEWGQFLPLHFKAYGEYKLPVQIYASIPATAVFGLNEFGVRITPVIYGTLTVLFTFFLASTLFKNQFIGLISAFLLATSPWHIQLTRVSFESSFSVFWVVLGMWLLVKGLINRRWLIYSMIPFAVSVYTYNSARIFTPVFLLIFFSFYKNELIKYKKIIGFSIMFFLILMIPLIPFVLNGEGGARYKLVSITDDPGLIPRINERRSNSIFPYPISRVVHNKVTYTGFYVMEHYLAHFTPDFLFISGAPHKQHHVQGMGELYLFQAPFLLFGLYLILKQKKSLKKILIPWLLIAFIPVSVTNDSIPHALRTLIAVPVYQIISAVGIYYAFIKLKSHSGNIYNLSLAALVFIVIISLGYYLKLYYIGYPFNYSRDWQYGYKQLVEYIKNNQQNYDLIVFSRHYGEPHMFTLFYLGYDPEKFQNNPYLERFETYDWVRVLRFDKFYFPDLGDQGTRYADIVGANPNKKILFIGKPGDFPQNLKKLKTINFLNNNPAFEIVE